MESPENHPAQADAHEQLRGEAHILYTLVERAGKVLTRLKDAGTLQSDDIGELLTAMTNALDGNQLSKAAHLERLIVHSTAKMARDAAGAEAVRAEKWRSLLMQTIDGFTAALSMALSNAHPPGGIPAHWIGVMKANARRMDPRKNAQENVEDTIKALQKAAEPQAYLLIGGPIDGTLVEKKGDTPPPRIHVAMAFFDPVAGARFAPTKPQPDDPVPVVRGVAVYRHARTGFGYEEYEFDRLDDEAESTGSAPH